MGTPLNEDKPFIKIINHSDFDKDVKKKVTVALFKGMELAVICTNIKSTYVIPLLVFVIQEHICDSCWGYSSSDKGIN